MLKSGLSLIALRLKVFSMFLPVAGIVQVYLQRVLGMDYCTTREFLRLWYAVFWVSAWEFASGVVVYIIDFFRMGRVPEAK